MGRLASIQNFRKTRGASLRHVRCRIFRRLTSSTSTRLARGRCQHRELPDCPELPVPVRETVPFKTRVHALPLQWPVKLVHAAKASSVITLTAQAKNCQKPTLKTSRWYAEKVRPGRMRENAVETSLNSCERAAGPGAKARHELIDASKREDAEAGLGPIRRWRQSQTQIGSFLPLSIV